MKKLKLHRPSPAMVVGIVACVLALGGGAIAATTKKKTKTAPKNSVVTKSIKNGAVKKAKLDASERSEGFQSKQDGEIALPATTDTTIATLSLPAGGKYLVNTAGALGKSAMGQVQCSLKDDGTVLGTTGGQYNGATQYTANASTTGFSDGGTVTLSCNPTDASTAKNRVITAVRVGSVTG